jgi:hypothetical protein
MDETAQLGRSDALEKGKSRDMTSGVTSRKYMHFEADMMTEVLSRFRKSRYLPKL